MAGKYLSQSYLIVEDSKLLQEILNEDGEEVSSPSCNKGKVEREKFLERF